MVPREYISEEFFSSHKEDLPTHYNFKSKVGNRYGHLEVLKYGWLDKEHKYLCKCDCGNYLVKSSSNLNNKCYRSCGCQINKSKRSAIESMIFDMQRSTEHEIVEANTLWDSYWTLNCKEHGNFKIKYSSVVRQNKGLSCPSCVTQGFHSNLPATFYVNSIKDLNGNLVAYKYGVTNKTADIRRKQIISKSDYSSETIFSFTNEDGSVILDFERLVKLIIPSKYMSKDSLKSGYTETIHPFHIITLANLINTFYKEI